MIAVICLESWCSRPRRRWTPWPTAKLATRTNAVIKLARAFRFAMDEAGVLFVGTCIVVFTAGRGAGGVGGELGQQVMQTLHTVI